MIKIVETDAAPQKEGCLELAFPALFENVLLFPPPRGVLWICGPTTARPLWHSPASLVQVIVLHWLDVFSQFVRQLTYWRSPSH